MRDVGRKQNKGKTFSFDGIYDGACATDRVYQESIKDVLPSLLEGYNCSVFVYGPTGTGKTFTMTGNDRAPGITYLLMADLFTKMTELKETKIFELAASYVENVKNENGLTMKATCLVKKENGKWNRTKFQRVQKN